MIYTAHYLYRILTVLSLLLAGSFVWQLIQQWDWAALLFLGVALWCTYRCFVIMSSKVELTEDRVRVSSVGATPREVFFRQLSGVYEEGRGLKSILLLYHPRAANGLYALDEELSLVLP
jgi:hypothetical protein